jgi:thiamine kinase-like enzyme
VLDNELIELLEKPLSLTGEAILYPLSGGTINRSYYLNDDSNEFMVKHFQGESSLCINRQEQFELQLSLSQKGLAPRPIYLSAEHGIYVEQWIKQHRSQLILFFDELHINSLATALTRIHQCRIKSSVVNLPREWQQYLTALTNPPSYLIEEVTKASDNWLASREASPENHVFCHNDLSWGHLCIPSKVILDWEYAGIGNRYFDVLSCAKVNGLNAQQHDFLLSAYAKQNDIPINKVYDACSEQARFLDLTYKLWYEAVGLEPEN